VTGRKALERNDAAYTELLRIRAACLRKSTRAAAALTQVTAEFAEFNHTGRFADGELENPLLTLADQMATVCAPASEPCPAFSRRRVLHVVTQAAGVGGHTRTIRHWVEADPGSCHSLLLTAQGRVPIPAWLIAAVEATGGRCNALPFPACPLVRAAQARAVVRSRADLVVLHHFGHDVVPVLALATGGPPVALVNHADHMFWMGGSVTDLVVHQRDIGRSLNQRRHVRRDVVLPVPLASHETGQPRPTVRARLGIPADQVVLLSVGRACKYTPTPSHNFFRVAHRILAAQPRAHLYLLGVTEVDMAGPYDPYRHERFHFLGVQDSAADYQHSADVYLEGFPFGSQTALLEAALAGVPVVRAFQPPVRLLATSDESLAGLAETPLSEDEYVERVGQLVGSAELRESAGSALREAVRLSHVGDGWKRRLSAVYARTDGLVHAPGPLPRTQAETTSDDLALSEWQVGRPSGVGARPARLTVRDTARQAAFALREARSHGSAFSVLRQAVRHTGPSRRLLADIAKLLPHRALTGTRG
jgi:hypothetical protein